LLKGFGCCSEGVLLTAVGAPSVFRRVEPWRWIPVVDGRAPSNVNESRPEKTVPERFFAYTAGRNDAETGDGDTPTATLHQSLPATKS
jgi:hypothetical protein